MFWLPSPLLGPEVIWLDVLLSWMSVKVKVSPMPNLYLVFFNLGGHWALEELDERLFSINFEKVIESPIPIR